MFLEPLIVYNVQIDPNLTIRKSMEQFIFFSIIRQLKLKCKSMEITIPYLNNSIRYNEMIHVEEIIVEVIHFLKRKYSCFLIKFKWTNHANGFKISWKFIIVLDTNIMGIFFKMYQHTEVYENCYFTIKECTQVYIQIFIFIFIGEM